VRIKAGGDSTERGGKTVLVTLTGTPPSHDIQVQLPVFADAGVRDVIGGSYDAATHTVTMFPQGHQVLVRLGKAGRPPPRCRSPAPHPASTR